MPKVTRDAEYFDSSIPYHENITESDSVVSV